MYLRQSKQKRADGREITYLQLAENVWDATKGRSQAQIVFNCGRADDPEVIDPDQPLFGRGLELDSLDTLEIVSLIDEEYDIALDDTPDAFGSISKIVDQILAKRD